MARRIRIEIPVTIEFVRGYRKLELPREVIKRWLSSQKSRSRTRTDNKNKTHSTPK